MYMTSPVSDLLWEGGMDQNLIIKRKEVQVYKFLIQCETSACRLQYQRALGLQATKFELECLETRLQHQYTWTQTHLIKSVMQEPTTTTSGNVAMRLLLIVYTCRRRIASFPDLARVLVSSPGGAGHGTSAHFSLVPRVLQKVTLSG